MRYAKTTPREGAWAVAMLNRRQNFRGEFKDIGERDVRREVLYRRVRTTGDKRRPCEL